MPMLHSCSYVLRLPAQESGDGQVQRALPPGERDKIAPSGSKPQASCPEHDLDPHPSHTVSQAIVAFEHFCAMYQREDDKDSSKKIWSFEKVRPDATMMILDNPMASDNPLF